MNHLENAPTTAAVQTVSKISAVPSILEVICKTTGMRFAAVARVTAGRWIACSVLDRIDFGLEPGGELQVETTICHETRQSRQPVVIEHVAQEPQWCTHATPAQYGFQSYISVPIVLADGSFFGTLCAIDPEPAQINNAETIGMFRLFAELIATQLDAAQKIAVTEGNLQASERSNEALQRFASIAAHDLREPLRQVSIFTSLLARKHREADAETGKYFGLVESATARMFRLLDGLMAFTQIDAMLSTPLQTANLQDSLNEALQGLTLSIQESAAVVTHDSLPQLHGDQSQLAQLFQNLISNAVKYRRKDTPPKIHISAARAEKEWIVSVADNGVGIPPQDRAKIFEVFTRLHGREIDGAGLGLALCSKVIELHGGRIWVEANPASAIGGSIFRFALPA
jgi:hypothetical protein